MKKRLVNRYPDIDNFGSRLLYLYDNAGLLNNGIINYNRVAVSLYDKGLCMYSYNADDKTIRSQTKNTADTLRKHIGIAAADNISGKWLNIYCSYFGCSCDFLMGYIKLPLHENTNISDYTGLSNRAISTLKALNNEYPTLRDNTILQALNSLLYNSNSSDILYNIGVYLGLDKDTIQNYIDSNDLYNLLENKSPLDNTQVIKLRIAGAAPLIIDTNNILNSLMDNIKQGLNDIKKPAAP